MICDSKVNSIHSCLSLSTCLRHGWGAGGSRGTSSVLGKMEDRRRRTRSAGAIEVEMSQRCRYREAMWQLKVVGVSGSLAMHASVNMWVRAPVLCFCAGEQEEEEQRHEAGRGRRRKGGETSRRLMAPSIVPRSLNF